MAVRMNYGSEEFRSSEETFRWLKVNYGIGCTICVSKACWRQNQGLAYTYLFIMPQKLCCGLWLEWPPRGTSVEGCNIFLWKIKNIIIPAVSLRIVLDKSTKDFLCWVNQNTLKITGNGMSTPEDNRLLVWISRLVEI